MGYLWKTAKRRSLPTFGLVQLLSSIARGRQSESIFFDFLSDWVLIPMLESKNMLLISSALTLVKIPSRLWHLVFSSVSNTVASFHLFVILHRYYNGNWKKGTLGSADLP